MSRMKGQHRILMEVVFFALGLLITIFVVSNFTEIENHLRASSLRSQVTSISNLVAGSIVKVSTHGSASVSMRIPARLSDEEYRISIENRDLDPCLIGEEFCVINVTSESGFSIRKQIFNITSSYNIRGRITSGEELVTLRKIGNDIVLEVSR
jgi:hypothetical protein